MTVWSLIIPTIILLGATISDIRTRKIYNKWVLVCICLALASSFFLFRLEGLQQGAVGGATALIMTLPLVLLGALGAGDMKLMFAFGLATTYSVVFSVIVVSFLWAGLIGIVFALVRGRGKLLAKNTYRVLTAQPRDESTFQKIPYSIALLLAWVTFIVFGLKQGQIL